VVLSLVIPSFLIKNAIVHAMKPTLTHTHLYSGDESHGLSHPVSWGLSSLSVEEGFECICALGILLSTMAIAGLHSPIVFGGLYVCYLSLYHVGQSMLSFQWDIFLLECGFACIILSLVMAASIPSETVRWLFRFQLFKILFMSGVVKTQVTLNLSLSLSPTLTLKKP
jgi:hypothetical protein